MIISYTIRKRHSDEISMLTAHGLFGGRIHLATTLLLVDNWESLGLQSPFAFVRKMRQDPILSFAAFEGFELNWRALEVKLYQAISETETAERQRRTRRWEYQLRITVHRDALSYVDIAQSKLIDCASSRVKASPATKNGSNFSGAGLSKATTSNDYYLLELPGISATTGNNVYNPSLYT
ncbi:hypothetical protein C8R42DRAFT_640670 [Lentinula raphanica]|nr:hypothetical protein C8R42DRAFT_640670 [Lentinula raphanica]